VDDLLASIREWPWAWAWLAFFVVVTLRAGATYAIGRGIAAGVLRRREPSVRVRTAMRQVDRWGPPVVTLSFFTVGVQTAVNLAAGLARMTWPRYLSGLLPGAVVWAVIWSTIGMTAFYAVFTGGAERLAWIMLLVLAVVVVVLLTRSMRQVPPPDDRDHG